MMVTLRHYIREISLIIRHVFLTKIYKMDIHKDAKISFGAKLDKTNPRGIHIGSESYIASGAIILSHDFVHGIHQDTKIGKKCFIGSNSIIMCGVTIGNEVIIGAGSIVTKDVPNNCIVAGNPATIIKKGIKTKKYGQII